MEEFISLCWYLFGASETRDASGGWSGHAKCYRRKKIPTASRIPKQAMRFVIKESHFSLLQEAAHPIKRPKRMQTQCRFAPLSLSMTYF